ncbi:MAG: hypothetical protein AABO58_08155 [Acidobacteriota bacterium]
MRHALRSGLLLLVLAAPLHAATITGEVIDSFCYAKVGIRGPAHAVCGIKCAKKGVPVALLEEKTRRVYILLAPKDAEPVPAALINQMGRTVKIEGETVVKGGTTFLVVRSFTR